MLSETFIRPARLVDVEIIAALMLEDTSDHVRRITILGSPYLPRFIADDLTGNKNNEYVMCTVNGRVVGMCAWRHADSALHLNYIGIAPDMRGQGLGTALMLDGLRRIRRTRQHLLSTDVFLDTPHAHAWYRSLRLRLEKRLQWIQLRLPSPRSIEGPRCTISGLDQAAADHLRYGFSHVSLTTNTGLYQVGRLGSDLFRVGTFTILQDAAALEALARFDAGRQLICIDTAKDRKYPCPFASSLIAESERLASPCATVLKKIEIGLSRRRHIYQSIPFRL